MAFNPRTPTPRALQVLARQQGGVVTRRQVRESGISQRAHSARLNTKYWIRHLGMTELPEACTNHDRRDAHALMHRAPAGTITGPTAARLQGCGIESTLVLVICAVDCHTRIPGAKVLRRPPAHPSHLSGGLRLTDPREAVLDTILYSRESERRELLDTALQRNWLTVSFVAETLAIRQANGQHTKTLRRIYASIRDGAHSEGERRMRRILARHQLGRWESNWLLHSSDGRPLARLDLAHLKLRIAIEVDGRAFHSNDEAFERDRWRQNQIALCGWEVLRFTWAQITKREREVAATVRAAMEGRQPPLVAGVNGPLKVGICP